MSEFTIGELLLTIIAGASLILYVTPSDFEQDHHKLWAFLSMLALNRQRQSNKIWKVEARPLVWPPPIKAGRHPIRCDPRECDPDCSGYEPEPLTPSRRREAIEATRRKHEQEN